MRIAFAPAAAFAFASVLLLTFLLLLGMPGVGATIVTLLAMGVTGHYLGWRSQSWGALALAGLFLVMAAFFLALGYPVFAQSSSVMPPTTSDTFGWGDFIGQLGVDIVPWAAVTLIAVVTAILPAPVKAFLTTQRTQQVEQLLERALGFGAAQLQDKLKGQTLTLDMHNQIVAAAVDYAWQHGSKAVLDFIGGQQALAPKLAARVLTSPAVQAAQGNIAPAQPVPVIPAA